MKRIRRRNLIVAVMLSLFLINVIMTIDTRYSSDVYKSQRLEEREANPSVAVSYVDHAPIDVTQDADFEKEDWVGEGTVISPYILSGFRFNTTGIGISIRKTSAYFKISHCLFIGSTSTTGILLDSLQNAVLTGNSFQQIHYAMICVRTENILINESIISNCTIALSLEKASEFNITFSDFSSTNTAIYAKQADKLLIGSCMFKMSENSIHCDSGSDLVIEDSVIQEGNFGILLEKVSSVNISEMVFQNLRYGIFASKCSQLKSIHNEYEECDFSIFVQSIDDAIISHCTITKAEYGLYLSSIDDFAVTMNHIEGSKFDGLNLASCTNGNVTHNSIEENQRHGIQLISSDNIRIYDNEIGWNKEENAVDSIGTLPFVPTNLWDDGNSRGNAYSDYSGSGRYKIPGTSGSEDRYPSYILFVASPADMTIEYGEEGYVLWNASALHPDRYHITTNSEVLEGGQWDGGPIQITIPANRYPGEYLYSLHINTTTNRSISDDVHVIIEDTNSPVWVIYPEDQSIEGGERFSYALQASDLSGITEYWVNDTSNFEITNGILRDMHVLSLGDYHLELRAYDAFDNYCFAEIIIAIEDTTPPDISHPPDYEYTLGATGNQIEWTFSDDYPISYEVLQGNDRILEGIWNDTASSLGLNIDGLSIGTHIFTLIIYDAGGNSASDEVTVSVVEDTTTTIETPTSIESSTTQTSTTTDQPDLAFPVLILGTMISTALLAVFILAKREH